MNSNRVCQGWLTKSSPAKRIFQPRWRRRWFVLRTGDLPHQFILEYFSDETSRRKKGHINLDECEEIAAPLVIQDRHKFTFNIRTQSRTYFFCAETEIEMKKWVDSLCHVCGLKTSENDGPGTNPSSAPANNLQPEEDHGVASDESSPTLSVSAADAAVSSGYIPISECITGKPIYFKDHPNNMKESVYCNTSFPFPPKVNWATYPNNNKPVKMVRNSIPNKPAVGPIPPPRPPKSLQSKSISDHSDISPFSPNSPTGVESSSPSYSIDSPPTSAGALYSNISDFSEPKPSGAIYMNPPIVKGDLVNISSPPPKVDRHLKPEARKNTAETSPFSYSSGSMTLPYSTRNNGPAGPNIDRSRKPPEQSHSLKLGPTPVQLKSHFSFESSTHHQHHIGHVRGASTSSLTLPANQRRRNGPLISPKVYHEYDTAQDLVYLQIDARGGGGGGGGTEPRIHNSHLRSSQQRLLHQQQQQKKILEEGGSVEYRLIDPVRTKALNQMIQEREEQLRT